MEVETIGRVRHKNLVRLLGYCVEGAYRCYALQSVPLFVNSFSEVLLLKFGMVVDRMLVYEYVENGNLDQWLHGDVGDVSPLTWEMRMNIVIGTAKG